MVKDKSGANLNNAYVFLEGWGSLHTSGVYYSSYEGLDNGTYRYKASKSGYTGSGWESITIADDDEIVTYVLVQDVSTDTHAAQKMSDEDVKRIYFPIMFAIFIFILIGGLKHVIQ